MKKIFYLMACLSIVSMFSACKNDDKKGDDGELSFKFPVKEYESPKAGGTKVIGFSTTEPFTVTVKYDVPLEADQADWVTVSPASGEAGHHFLTLNFTEHTSFDDRTATVTVTSGKNVATMTVAQLASSALTLNKALYEIGAKGGEVELSIKTNRDFVVTVDEASKEWIHLDEAKGAVLQDTTAKVSVDPNTGLDSRFGYVWVTELNEDPQAEVITRRAAIKQRGDFGYFITRAATPSMKMPTLVREADGSYKAFYAYTTPGRAANGSSHPSEYWPWKDNGQSPYDVSGAPIGVRFTTPAAFNQIRISVCTWSNDTGGGNANFSLYVWDTDYLTTIANNPIYSKDYTGYPDNAWFQFMPVGGPTWAAGDYLAVLKSDHTHSGLWYTTSANDASVQGYQDGVTTSKVIKLIADCIETADDSKVVATYMSSADGETWSEQKYIFPINDAFLWHVYNATDMRVTKIGDYYYALVGEAGNLMVTRGKEFIPKDKDVANYYWDTWRNGSWGSWNFSSAWDGVSPVSLVELNGTMFLYAMKENKLMVRTASSVDNWPAELGAETEAFVFAEATNTNVTYSAAKAKFVATYIKDNQMYELYSTDGKTFTEGGMVISKMFDGAAAARYVVGGGDDYLSYACNSGWYLKIMKE
ncbi:MAG: BACON domain-containing protein [Alistipes sp.]|nr:BACON domain-containing protein [Alistipes sp.]